MLRSFLALAPVVKLMNRLFLQFSNFCSRAAVKRGYLISGYGGTPIYETKFLKYFKTVIRTKRFPLLQ
jgi:hypothetical protein